MHQNYFIPIFGYLYFFAFLMNKINFILLLCLFCNCIPDHGKLTFLTKLPIKLGENSGIEVYNNSSIWVIEDGNNEDKIYEVNYDGTLLKELKVKHAKNRDWEDLAMDENGNIYIADFGNNYNKRKDLVIYKIPNPEKEKGKKIDAEKIKFHYPEQKKFPPKKENRFYDAEALFYKNNALYIITRNRSKPFSGETSIYKIPATKGNYEAQLIGKFTTCSKSNTCQVTAADISPDGKKIALLGYGNLWIFTDFTLDNFTTGKMETIDLETYTQLESVCFTDNETLLISDEDTGFSGRNLYSFSLKKNIPLKPKTESKRE